MAATIIINRWTGASGSPTETNITSANTVASTSDVNQTTAAGSSNPIVVPSSGSNYSFWVSTRLNCTVSPAGTVNNLQWYTDAATFGTGVTCIVQNATAYTQATGTVGTTGTQLTTGNYPGLTGAPVAHTTYTSGATKTLSGSISNPSTGDFGDFMVYQIVVGTTAGPGVTSTSTFTWLYDET